MTENYDENHCWQYDIRLKNYESDLINSKLTDKETKSLTVSDFDFAYEEKNVVWKEAKDFILKHEWLGKMGLYPTHIFTARYKGILAGVVVMDMPNAFSKLLGENTRKIERLISRGACISWSPKNLASALISYSIKWMVENTRFRLFIAYSDTEAKELGTIYQACNFYYIGRSSGASKQYQLDNGRWVSDRYFRSRSVYKKKAKEAGIDWLESWQNDSNILWNNMSNEVESEIRKLSKNYMLSCPVKTIPKKHKYCYVLGKNKGETKSLKRDFESKNKKLIKPYPKERGK
jgi:hypothetical protein